jgi:hypothetical protein
MGIRVLSGNIVVAQLDTFGGGVHYTLGWICFEEICAVQKPQTPILGIIERISRREPITRWIAHIVTVFELVPDAIVKIGVV